MVRADEVEFLVAIVVGGVLEEGLGVKEGGRDDKVTAAVSLALDEDALFEELLETCQIEVLSIDEADIIVSTSLRAQGLNFLQRAQERLRDSFTQSIELLHRYCSCLVPRLSLSCLVSVL